jgi:hypothetical protein
MRHGITRVRKRSLRTLPEDMVAGLFDRFVDLEWKLFTELFPKERMKRDEVTSPKPMSAGCESLPLHYGHRLYSVSHPRGPQ